MAGSARKQDPVWEEALDWLLRLQAAPTDVALIRERDAWIAASPAHADAYRRAEKVWRLTGDVAPATRWASPRPAWRGRAMGLAVGLLAACLVLFLAPAAMLRLEADHRTVTGEIRTVSLADGSRIDLDTASAVAVDYRAGERAVQLLAGRAFFEVAADQRPFTVQAGDVTVTVTGTGFDLRRDDHRVAVAVQHGGVTVAGGGGSGAPVRLGLGDRLSIDTARGISTRGRVVPSQIAAWRQGRLIADGATVAEVVAELGRYHAGFVFLTDPALGTRRVTGIYDLRDPAAALRALVQPHGGQVREVTPYLLLVERPTG